MLNHHKYGMLSREVESQTINKRLPAIGVKAYFDVHEDFAYFAWEGNLRIIKIDLYSGNIEKIFGEKTENYLKPDADELVEAYRKKNFALLISKRKEKS